MAKKIVAKTNISHGKPDGTVVELAPGDEVNQADLGLTKTQLEQLYDAGAIELQESADAREEEETPASDSQENAPPVKATKSTPTKATSSGTGNAA